MYRYESANCVLGHCNGHYVMHQIGRERADYQYEFNGIPDTDVSGLTIIKREPDKLFYLIPDLDKRISETGFDTYVNYSSPTNKFWLDDTDEVMNIKTKFTQKEIDSMALTGVKQVPVL